MSDKDRNMIRAKWSSMMDRVYSGRDPDYSDCTVCQEWHTDENFINWSLTQDWKGKQIDKDLLVFGNREYAPDKCCFLTNTWNTIFQRRKSREDESMPIGVYPSRRNFAARIKIYGKDFHLGSKGTPLEAHELWQEAMIGRILRFAETQPEPIRSALIFRANRIQSHINDGIETHQI